MRSLKLAVILLLFTALNTGAVETRDPDEHFFDQSLGDFSEELEVAREDGKKGILMMFEMDECPFCHRMKTTVLNRADVQDYFKEHFLIFPVDIEGDVEVTDFSGELMKEKDFAFKQFRVRATPVFAFFDLDGKLVAKYTGATRNAEEFMLLGRYVADGAYGKTSFTRYKREQRKAKAP